MAQAPVAGKFPQRRQLYALRPIVDELSGGPPCGRDPAAKIRKVRLWNLHIKRTNRMRVRCLSAAFLYTAGLDDRDCLAARLTIVLYARSMVGRHVKAGDGQQPDL